MILRITYCTVAFLLCIVIGLLIEAPDHLIAEMEPAQIQPDENPEDYLLPPHAANSFKEEEHNRSRMISQLILNDAIQRELNSKKRFHQASMPQILPATVTHRSRKNSLSINPLQNEPLRKSGLPNRNLVSVVFRSTQQIFGPNSQFDQPGFPGERDQQSQSLPAFPKQEVVPATPSGTPEDEVMLSAVESDYPATVPAGFLGSPKPNSADGGKKPSLFKRALKGLNRRSEPQTGANKSSQSSAPRRFIPTNPLSVSQADTSVRQTGEFASQGQIVQAQQNSSITRELEKLYRKDGRQMPQMRTPNISRLPQGTAANQGFAPGRIAPGNNAGNQQQTNQSKKPPLWKRLFSIGRKKQPQQNQPQYNPPPQQVQQPQYNNQPQFDNQPQYGQQPQYNPQPSFQQLPNVPASIPNYGSRNKPGIPGNLGPAAFPFSRQNPTNISRTPLLFPGNASGTRNRNSEPLQSLFPKQRRINGDAPQFNSFSEQFDPFAIPQEITEPETPPVNSVDVQRAKTCDPLGDDFNPFEEPEEPVGAQTQSAESPQQSTADSFSDNFDPFGDLENAEDSVNATQDQETKSADTTQTNKNRVAPPTEQESGPFQEPKQLQPENLAPVPPAPPVKEQTAKAASSDDSVSEDSLEDAFPDVSETEADRNNPDENPFTGLKLDDEPDDRTDTSAVPAPQKTVPDTDNTSPDAKKDESPRFDDSQNTDGNDDNTSEKPAQTTENRQTQSIIITPADAPKPFEKETANKAENTPKNEISEKPKLSQAQRKKIHLKEKREKLKQISARFGLKGFKGFCPVALRDQRELTNSKSKFKAIFESRLYYFSSSEARDKFENDPEHYAPVHGGKDIVILRDDEKKVQGSLDHAVWFKDRLFLFSRADSLKTFIKTPKQYLNNSTENEAAGDELEAKDSDDSGSLSLLFSENEE